MMTDVAADVMQAQKVAEQEPYIRLQAAQAHYNFVDAVLFDVLSAQQVLAVRPSVAQSLVLCMLMQTVPSMWNAAAAHCTSQCSFNLRPSAG